MRPETNSVVDQRRTAGLISAQRTGDDRLRVPDGQQLLAHPSNGPDAGLLLLRFGEEGVGDRRTGLGSCKVLLLLIGCSYKEVRPALVKGQADAHETHLHSGREPFRPNVQ